MNYRNTSHSDETVMHAQSSSKHMPAKSKREDSFSLSRTGLNKKSSMRNKKAIEGVYAAVLMPRDELGRIQEKWLIREIELLLEKGIRGFAINGATGEYCLTSRTELERILEVVRDILPKGARFLCGVGSIGWRESVNLGEMELRADAEALLLPMPYFFPYEQDDLQAFVQSVSSRVSGAILLYNLPQFTSGLKLSTVETLFAECENVVGIKDSSGSLEILRALTTSGKCESRLLGDDSLFPYALRKRLCDGNISGVACVLPELILGAADNDPDSDVFRRSSVHLAEFIERIKVLPVPWGLKAIAEAREIAPMNYVLPLSARRAAQIRDLQVWFKGWEGNPSREVIP